MEDIKTGVNNQYNYMEVSPYTLGKDLYNFIKQEMPFEEVINLYRLLEGDIKGELILIPPTKDVPITKEMLDRVRNREWMI